MQEEKQVSEKPAPAPKEVQHAGLLIFLSIMTGMTEFFLELLGIGSRTIEIDNYELNAILSFAVNFVFIMLILNRKGWARAVFTFLFVINTLGLIPIVQKEFQSDLIGATSSILQTLFSLAAIVFFYSKNSNGWFKKEKPPVKIEFKKE